MSFADRVNSRLRRWMQRNPGAPADAVERQRRSITRRLQQELEQQREERRKDQAR